MTRIAGSGYTGLIALANTLTATLSPKGIVNPFTGKETKIYGFSTSTAVNLFTPLENVIEQKNLLIEQATIRGFLERQEAEKQDRLPAWARATRRLDDNVQPRRDLKQRAQDLIAEINAKFEPDDTGAVFTNRNPSADSRPTETEIFGNLLPGYTINGSLTPTNMPRLGVTPGETVAAGALMQASMNTTPEKVLVRLDSGSRDTSEGADNALRTPSGSLDLNGTILAGNTVHELTYAEYQQLNYVAGGKDELDYLSVVGVDHTGTQRGEMTTTALSASEFVEHRIINDQKVYEFTFLTERDAYFSRFEITFEGNFANKEDPGDAANSFMGDLNAEDIEMTMFEAGNIDNPASIALADTDQNTVTGFFTNGMARDGVLLRVNTNNYPTVDITDIRVRFS